MCECHVHVYVCILCLYVGAHAPGVPRLMSEAFAHCSSTLFIEAESLLLTQNSLIKLVLQSVCIRHPLYSAIQGWNHRQADNPT